MNGVPGDPGRERRIPVAGTFNLRDLGGYPAAGNRSTRWRTLLRSDAPHLIDAAGMELLAGYGLRTVIDLRTAAEIGLAPSALRDLTATSLQICLLGDDLRTSPRELDAIYRYFIHQRADTVTAVIRQLCQAGSVPALVHCSAGKDRTGIVIALILAVLGVPDEIIAADYALTASYLNPQTTAAVGQLRAGMGADDRLTADLLASPAGLILDTLAWVRAAGGSVGGYLTAHGATAGELDALRAALLTTAP